MAPPFLRGSRPAADLLVDDRGNIGMMTGLLLSVSMGVLALAVDMSHVYVARAALQQVADSAALSGALACVSTTCTSGTTKVTQTVADVVQANGYPATVIQNSAAEYVNPSPINASDSAIKVSLQTSVPLWFAPVLTGTTSLNVGASAIADVTTGSNFCVLSLSVSTAATINGYVNLGTCGIAVDDSANTPLQINNSGTLITSTGVLAVGIASGTLNTVGGNQYINTGTTLYGQAVADPYAQWKASLTAVYNSCSASSPIYLTVNQGTPGTLNTPGCYNITMNGNSDTLYIAGAGTYAFQQLNINNNDTLIATAPVTLVVNGFSPNGPVTLTAPTSGTYAGVGIFSLGQVNMNSTAHTYDINGAIYAPNSYVAFTTSTTNGSCTMIVAESINVTGGATIDWPTSCSGFPGPAGGSSGVVLAQ